jgi:phosphotransferase system HPr-like phosphotransfer protein
MGDDVGVYKQCDYKFEIDITNRNGLHPRRTKVIADFCGACSGEVEIGIVEVEGARVIDPIYKDAKSIWDMLRLPIVPVGSKAEFRLYGFDDSEANNLEEELRDGFRGFDEADMKDQERLSS